MKLGFVVSAALHGLLFWALLSHGALTSPSQSQNDKELQGDRDTSKIVEAPDKLPPLEIQIVDADDKGFLEAQATPRPEESQCKNFFGGIGITFSLRYSKDGFVPIGQVVPGYPAAQEGLEPGDWISIYPEIRGEIGTTVVAKVIKNGTPYSITFTRAKICLEDVP